MAYATKFFDPGKQEEAVCDICSEKMLVSRNVNGPTGYAEAISKHGHLHDRFVCPYRDDMWHKQVAKNWKRYYWKKLEIFCTIGKKQKKYIFYAE